MDCTLMRECEMIPSCTDRDPIVSLWSEGSFEKDMELYWDERATTYSNGIIEELNSPLCREWEDIIRTHIISEQDVSCQAPSNRLDLREADQRQTSSFIPGVEAVAFSFALMTERKTVIDLGCGPGFFDILLSNLGCDVIAIDASQEMLDRAAFNVARHGDPDRVRFIRSDISAIDLPDGICDAIILRNVTWLVSEPRAAYREWRRLLKDGGTLLAFDANWYRYLVDAPTNELRLVQQAEPEVLGWADDAKANSEQETQCELLALELPLTYELRPAWDQQVLPEIGFREVSVDKDIWKRVWSEGEQRFYGSSPLFMIKAVK